MIKRDIYDISVRIFLTFKNQYTEPLKAINHSEKTIEKYKSLIPYGYTSYSKDTIIAMCLYLNFYQKPKSIPSMFKMLGEIKAENITNFKDDIKNYKKYLLEEYKFIIENKIKDVNTLFNLFIQKKLKFITFYYIIQKFNLEKEIKSRTFKTLYLDLKTLMIFLKLNLDL